MKTDDLDTLSDSALSEAFAVEVAGWKAWLETRGEYTHWIWQRPSDKEPWMSVRSERRAETMKCYTPARLGGFNANKHVIHFWPQFATSADAVLPWLDKAGSWRASHTPEFGHAFGVQLREEPIAYALTFARAACIALIRAKRAEKETVK